MKKKLFVMILMTAFSAILFLYIDGQINVKIKYYEISKREELKEELQNERRKLLLEYYTLLSYEDAEKEAMKEPLLMNYGRREPDIELKNNEQHEK